jgi:hypothetical protein
VDLALLMKVTKDILLMMELVAKMTAWTVVIRVR